MTVRFYNNGNAPIGYDLFLEAPSGWQAGFTNLGSEAGALSGSTGLINSEAYRAVGLMFTPPQVMTAAGAERIVRLTAVSQTENAELEVFEIPIRVMAIEDVLINVESNLGTLRPDSTITLQYSLEHKGNVELDLTPSFELPGGWSVSSSSRWSTFRGPPARTSSTPLKRAATLGPAPSNSTSTTVPVASRGRASSTSKRCPSPP